MSSASTPRQQTRHGVPLETLSIVLLLHNLSVLKRLALRLPAPRFCSIWFRSPVDGLASERIRGTEGCASRLATGNFIRLNPRFSWAISPNETNSAVQDETSTGALLLGTRRLTIFAFPLKSRNLLARSVLRHSSDNERWAIQPHRSEYLRSLPTLKGFDRDFPPASKFTPCQQRVFLGFVIFILLLTGVNLKIGHDRQ